MNRPNFFIVGAARSGTTSLWSYLKSHDNIFMPSDELNKEPGFFSTRGEHIGFQNYLVLFREASNRHKLIGEASTAYLTDPVSAARIFEFNPNSKIIIMLRNPADRAYSLYNWMVQDGYEYASTFEEALRLEKTRILKVIPNWLETEYYWNYLYFSSGLYYEQVKRYRELFADNLLIIIFEELVNDFQTTCGTLCSFLGIRNKEIPWRRDNPSRGVYSSKIQCILRNVIMDSYYNPQVNITRANIADYTRNRFLFHMKNLSRVARYSIRERIMLRLILYRALNIVEEGEIPSIDMLKTKNQRDHLLTLGLTKKEPEKYSQRTRTTLLNDYRRDVDRLEELTGLDFSAWFV